VGRAENRGIQEEANRVLLERYGPAGVVVDANFDIVQFRGHTGPYLESPTGEPSFNVLKMARGGLLHPLRTALGAARRKRRPVRKESVLVQTNGDWRAVDLQVLPLAMQRGEFFLVLFETPPAVPAAASRRPRGPARTTRSGRGAGGRLLELERELAASREYLQSIIQELEAANDELQSANEEILSANEELQSTNEELDTAKEELQSTNEELNTVNDELHSRNEELARLNSDLVNLLASVDLPIVIVGDDLTVRRFTPGAEALFNLIQGDVGRPILQIKPNLAGDDLEGLIRSTIDTVAPREQEIQGGDGCWYSLRVRPYKGVDNRLDGAVITAIDIDASRRYQRQVERSRDYFMKIVETVKQPLLVLDGDLRVSTANASFAERFRLRQPIAGASIYQLDGGRWDLPQMRELLAAAVDGDAGHRGVSQEVVPSSDEGRRLVVSARRFEIADDSPWILVAVEDKGGEETR
jgi:two-component system CheB/CheR fusion protein